MMSDTRTISTKETMINMKDMETASDTETMSEGEIAKHMQVRSRAPRVGLKTTNSLDDVGILDSFPCSS